MTEDTTQLPNSETTQNSESAPTSNFPEYEYLELTPVNVYCNWVLGKPFKNNIATLDTQGVIAYINQIISSITPMDLEVKRFWEGYKAGLLGKDKITDDEIFAIGYSAALGIIKPPPPKRKTKKASA